MLCRCGRRNDRPAIAVELIARNARNGNLYPTIVYRDEAVVAWRKLCGFAPIAARTMTGDGFLRKPDPVQFEGFADKYCKFASVLRYRPMLKVSRRKSRSTAHHTTCLTIAGTFIAARGLSSAKTKLTRRGGKACLAR
jgi:hypothetical protein